MARSSMASLIARTRVLISDTAGASQVFTDDQIEDTLDQHRLEQRQVPLQPGPTFAAGGAIFYLDFYGDGVWEDDIVLQDTGWNVVTPSVSEPLAGHWHFAAQPAGLGVRATGKTYDLYGAAADLLDAWAAQVKLEFSFQNKQDIYSRNQKFAMLNSLANDYRKLALVRHSRLTQSDAASDTGTNAVTYPACGDSW